MSAAAHRALPVPEGLAGERLDSGLARLFGLSRSRAVELIESGNVRLDGAQPAKSERLVGGRWLEVDLPATVDPVPEPRSTDRPRIIHADEHLLVVDKPAGTAAHPSPGWVGPTVVGQLAAIGTVLATGGADERQGVVHRLDVGTSGVMVLARSEPAYSRLKRAFRERSVEKTYHALVQGHPDPSRGTVDAPIDRHPRHDGRWAVVAGGRPSVTHYETLEAHRYASLLRIGLETGRTHQIRVHMSALHHPCVGDLAYGADPVLAARLELRRQWLHAVSLRLRHPATDAWVEYSSPYPDDLARALEEIRGAQ
jgi:23S rRNA pseudouridine1911/1915/1917 synthase